MAAVAFGDGTVRELIAGESKIVIWISPTTMDSADTVVLPTITGKTPRVLSAFDATDGDHISATISSQTVTLDAGGGATDSVYHLTFTYI